MTYTKIGASRLGSAAVNAVLPLCLAGRHSIPVLLVRTQFLSMFGQLYFDIATKVLSDDARLFDVLATELVETSYVITSNELSKTALSKILHMAVSVLLSVSKSQKP